MTVVGAQVEHVDGRPRVRIGARGVRRLGLAWLAIGLLACAEAPPAVPLPRTVDESFFPLAMGTWWEFESELPGFPGRGLRDRFVLKAPDANGRFEVGMQTLNIHPGIPAGKLELQHSVGGVRMFRDGDPVDILRFGARVGDTWCFNPARPQYRAHLCSLGLEFVLDEWHPVAEVRLHAGGIDAPVVRTFWFARGVGWIRILQQRPMGSPVTTTLVDAHVRRPAGR
ncbi:MAG: hypothetical protein JXQ29_06255 [Planctomycetes bacterium]|nr:hypothetical protein [Planctomycetota bacterium]